MERALEWYYHHHNWRTTDVARFCQQLCCLRCSHLGVCAPSFLPLTQDWCDEDTEDIFLHGLQWELCFSLQCSSLSSSYLTPWCGMKQGSRHTKQWDQRQLHQPMRLCEEGGDSRDEYYTSDVAGPHHNKAPSKNMCGNTYYTYFFLATQNFESLFMSPTVKMCEQKIV